MEELFLQLQKNIADNVPELSVIDEDYGQLENLLQPAEDMYPLTFPCALISMPAIDWQALAHEDDDEQQGTATFTTRVAIDCYDDTHHTSGTAHKIRERLAMVNKVHQAVRQTEYGEYEEKPLRRSTRTINYPGAIKVYETTYTIAITDE